MDERGRYLADLIRSGARAYAAGATVRQTGQPGEGEVSFREMVADTEERLLRLAQALQVGRVELFCDHLAWAKVAYVARGAGVDYLEGNLEALRAEFEENLPPEGRELALRYVDVGRKALAEAPSSIDSFLADGTPHVDLARRFLVAVLEGRGRDAADQLVAAVDAGLSVADAHHFVLSRVQAEVGRMWQMDEIDVADEHLTSRVVESALVRLGERLPRQPSNDRRVVVASAGGDLHDIGPRMVADHFEMAGWRSMFLGANTPAEDLLRAVDDFGAHLLALSVSNPEAVGAAADVIAAVRARGNGAPPVLVGGSVFVSVPELWKDVGADGFATGAAEGPGVGARLVDGAA